MKREKINKLLESIIRIENFVDNKIIDYPDKYQKKIENIFKEIYGLIYEVIDEIAELEDAIKYNDNVKGS